MVLAIAETVNNRRNGSCKEPLNPKLGLPSLGFTDPLGSEVCPLGSSIEVVGRGFRAT